jgi:DNA primase
MEHSALWEDLAEEDRLLLHDLPGPHGDLVRWLERLLLNVGPTSWAAVEAALISDGYAGVAAKMSALLQIQGPHADPLNDLVKLVSILRQEVLKRAVPFAPGAFAPMPPGSQVTDADKRRSLELLEVAKALRGAGRQAKN